MDILSKIKKYQDAQNSSKMLSPEEENNLLFSASDDEAATSVDAPTPNLPTQVAQAQSEPVDLATAEKPGKTVQFDEPRESSLVAPANSKIDLNDSDRNARSSLLDQIYSRKADNTNAKSLVSAFLDAGKAAGGVNAHGFADKAGILGSIENAENLPLDKMKEEQSRATVENNIKAVQLGNIKNKAETEDSMSKRDTNSVISRKFAKELSDAYANLGQSELAKRFEGMSYNDAIALDKTFGDLLSKKLQIDSAKDARADRLDRKKQDQENKDAIKFAEGINSYKGRAGALGDVQKKINKIQSLEVLLGDKGIAGVLENPSSIPNLNDIQMREFSTGVASLLSSGGAVAQSQIDELTPHSLRGSINKQIQWLQNEPRGADQQKFLENFVHLLNREKTVSTKQLYEGVAKSAGAYGKRVKDNNPEEYARILKQNGVEPQFFDKNGAFDSKSFDEANKGNHSPSSKSMSDQDKQALEWANKNPDDKRAKQIKDRLGVN